MSLDIIRSLLAREPLVIVGALASGAVLLAGHFHIVLDKASVQTVLEPVVLALIGRAFVSPAVKSS